MRIAWCTPFAERSRIGEFSAVVVTELRSRRGIDVDLFYPAGAGGRTEPDPGEALDGTAIEQLGAYDAVFYNMGDHWGYHGPLLRLIKAVPGIVILHDVSFTHLMLPKLMALSERELADEFHRRYGSGAAEVAAKLTADFGQWPWQPENVEHHPLLSFVLDDALGVVTHSRFAARRVRTEYAGDVWSVPLPALHVAHLEAPMDLIGIDDRPIVLQAGSINRTKCVPTVIEAFAIADVADRAQLVICGFAEPGLLHDLHRTVAEWNLGDSVHIMGAVSDELLDALRKRASIATVLRYPIGEAASAALLDSMAYGLGVVTVDAAHYAEMPEDTLLRVKYPPAPTDVARAIRYWVDNPGEAARIGARALEHVRSEHSVAQYAERIAAVAGEGGSVRRRQDLASDVCRTIARIGFGPDDSICDTVVATATRLFGGQPRMAHEIVRADTSPTPISAEASR